MIKFKKLLSVILAVMMVMTSLPTFANTSVAANGPIIPEGAILIFAEDFESGFDTGVNLLEADGAVEFFKDGKKTLKLSQPAGTTTGYVAKVDAVDGFDGNALYLESSVQPARADGTVNNNARDNNLKFEVFFDGGNAIDTKSADSPYYGMQIVYEFDAKVSGLRERQFMKLDSSGAGSVANKPLTPFQSAAGRGWTVRDGEYASSGGPWHISCSADMTNKATMRVVFDQTGAVDVVRTYRNDALVVADWTNNVKQQGSNYNGKIKKDFVGEYYAANETVDMSAPSYLLTYICPSSGATAKAYIDNIVVYAIPSIEFLGFESTTNVNPEEGLQVQFDQPFNATDKTFKVTTTEGTDVANAITAVEMSDDKKTATIKMNLDAKTSYKLWLDDEFASEAGAIFYSNPLGISAVDEYIELDTFTTCEILALDGVTPEAVADYIQGVDQEIVLTFNDELALTAEELANAFEVKDGNDVNVEGLVAVFGATKDIVVLQLKDLVLGEGKHTIKAKEGIVDSRGRNLEFEYNFDIMPFIANYETEITGYVPGSEKVVEIGLTYPLNADSIANLDNAFVVKNQYGSNVSGLVVTTSEDNKKILLDLSTLDITGGTYVIASKPGAFVNVKDEVLDDVVIDLTTAATIVEDVKTDAGVAPNAGVEFDGEFTSTLLLSENFDNEGYTRDLNWLSSDSFVPARFQLDKVGKANDFVDASVSIVEDPLNPGNYVLKNVSGFRDATGTIIAGNKNFHKVKRELDDGTASIPVDDYTVVRLSTKIMIPTGGGAGAPTGDNKVPEGDTKDLSTIIALTDKGTTALNHANLRQGSGTVQYSSYIPASGSAANASGIVSAALSTDTWHTVELVFGYNPKKDGSKFKSYEVYIDGVKKTELGGAYAYNGSDYSTIGGMMSVLASASGSSGSTIVYYDDWSIVKTNKLLTHINVPKENVKEDQEIKLQLTSKLTDASVALIEEKGLLTVKDDEGNDVEATIVFDNTGANTKIAITPEYGLKYNTGYVVNIEGKYEDETGVVTYINDVYGNAFPGFTYSFETAKSFGNTIDMESCVLSYDADFMQNETEFNYTMKLKEVVDETPIIGAVATYNKKNKLLGIDYQVFNLGEDSKAFTVSSELGTELIKTYLWEQNADGTIGKAYQKPDQISSRMLMPTKSSRVSFDASDIKVTNAAQGIITVASVLEDAARENKYVTIIVLSNTASLNSYAENTLALDVVEADLAGNFSVSFGFDEPTGVYDFYVLYNGEAYGPVMYNFISLEDTANVIKNIANGSIPKDSIVPQILAANNGIGLDFNRFPVGFDRDLFVYRMDKARAEIVGNTDAEVLASFNDLVDKIEEEIAFVKAVNAVTYSGDYMALLYNNVKYTGIDFTAYNALDESLKVKVTDEFLGKTFNNGDEIKEAFDKAVVEAAQSSGDIGDEGNETNGPVISVSKERCRVGNTVDVVVSISNNTGFANLGLEIDYDRALTLVGVKENSSVGAVYTSAQNFDVHPYNFIYDATSDVMYNGELVTLTFEVPEDTQPGDYFVNVDFYKGRNGDYVDGVSVNYNGEYKPLRLCYENGSVKVYNYIPGDIDGDGVVNSKDGTALLRYLAGWNITNINENALDTDGNGVVNNKDGTALLRYLAGWNVEVY